MRDGHPVLAHNEGAHYGVYFRSLCSVLRRLWAPRDRHQVLARMNLSLETAAEAATGEGAAGAERIGFAAVAAGGALFWDVP